jgi:hypothetical protein
MKQLIEINLAQQLQAAISTRAVAEVAEDGAAFAGDTKAVATEVEGGGAPADDTEAAAVVSGCSRFFSRSASFCAQRRFLFFRRRRFFRFGPSF